jgi:hypothetical protein
VETAKIDCFLNVGTCDESAQRLKRLFHIVMAELSQLDVDVRRQLADGSEIAPDAVRLVFLSSCPPPSVPRSFTITISLEVEINRNVAIGNEADTVLVLSA